LRACGETTTKKSCAEKDEIYDGKRQRGRSHAAAPLFPPCRHAACKSAKTQPPRAKYPSYKQKRHILSTAFSNTSAGSVLDNWVVNSQCDQKSIRLVFLMKERAKSDIKLVMITSRKKIILRLFFMNQKRTFDFHYLIAAWI